MYVDYASVKVPKNGILYKLRFAFSPLAVLNPPARVLQLPRHAVHAVPLRAAHPSRALDNLVVVKLNVDNAVLGDGLDKHALEVDG
jgi:hypothetical protein